MRISLLFLFIFLPLFSESAELKLLSEQHYAKLNSLQQTWYSTELQKAWLDFELAYPKAGEINDQALWRQMILPDAFAAAAKCVVGGVVQKPKVVNGKTVCPTQGRPCVGNNDGYLCGSIFASTCVPRTPARGVASRCAQPKTTASTSTGTGTTLNPQALPLTPAQYKTARKDTLQNYEDLCAEKAPNSQEQCNNLALRTEALSKSPNVVVNNSPITPDPNFTASAANCRHGYDPATGKPLELPRFGFDPEYSCLYKRNQENLYRLANSDCKAPGKKVGNELFLTRFRSKSNSTVFNGGNVFDVIVEDVNVMQKTGANDVIYNVQALVPSANKPVGLDRKTLQVKFSGGQYYLCTPDCSGKQEPVDIDNAVRSNIMPEYMKAISRTAMDSMMDGKVMLAMNCRLAQELSTKNLYSSGSVSSAAGTPAGAAPKAGSKVKGTR